MSSNQKHLRQTPAEPSTQPGLDWGHPLYRAPRVWHDWLGNSGSLTARLKARFVGFHVCVIRQGWHTPNGDERALLGIRNGELALVREVLLMNGTTPLVYAHSVMPGMARRRGFTGWRKQGTRALGATLFADHRVKRGALAFARLDARHALYRRARLLTIELPAHAWARRSLFSRGGGRILVTEVFLNAMLAGD